MTNSLSIEKRIDLSVALREYLQAVEQFDKAFQTFNDACANMRKQLSEPQRFIAQVRFEHYLVTSDAEGNFDVEPILVI